MEISLRAHILHLYMYGSHNGLHDGMNDAGSRHCIEMIIVFMMEGHKLMRLVATNTGVFINV